MIVTTQGIDLVAEKTWMELGEMLLVMAAEKSSVKLVDKCSLKNQ